MRYFRAAGILALVVLMSAAAVNAVEDGTPDAKLLSALGREREQRIADLHGYAEEGIFPHNHGHAGQRVPYFMDRHGRLCAVGFLIAKSMAGTEWHYQFFMNRKDVARSWEGMGVSIPGAEERKERTEESARRLTKLQGFFDKIATTNNNVRVKDVKDGPVLDWILTSGLTQEEAAIIQPGYTYLACDACLPGSEAKKKSFGKPTEEAKRVEAEDQTRIRAHLAKVEKMLRASTAASLKTAAARLKARGQAWPLKPRNL